MTTEFKSETTNQGIKEDPNFTMMDPKAEKMASHSAPSSAFEVRTSSTAAVKE
jgi:hypothetical protein